MDQIHSKTQTTTLQPVSLSFALVINCEKYFGILVHYRLHFTVPVYYDLTQFVPV